MKVNIGFPVVRSDGRAAGGRAVYGHVITKFSGMGRFTQLWGSAHACVLRARRAPLKLSTCDRTIDPKNLNVSTSRLQSIVDSILKPILPSLDKRTE